MAHPVSLQPRLVRRLVKPATAGRGDAQLYSSNRVSSRPLLCRISHSQSWISHSQQLISQSQPHFHRVYHPYPECRLTPLGGKPSVYGGELGVPTQARLLDNDPTRLRWPKPSAVVHSAMVQQHATIAAASGSSAGADGSAQAPQHMPASPLLRHLIAAFLSPYLKRNPTAARALDLIRSHEGAELHHDHYAFRTFGVDGFGITSLSHILTDLGYSPRDDFTFPAKKLLARWFAPPAGGAIPVSDGLRCRPPGSLGLRGSVPSSGGLTGNGDEMDGGWSTALTSREVVEGSLPRVFVSELKVEELSRDAQEVIHRYLDAAGRRPFTHAAVSSVLSVLPWPIPTLRDYQILARESEYAAWTLVNGYSLNHTTVSVHALRRLPSIAALNTFLEGNGFSLNSEGGKIKVSPDGGLLQSSTVADMASFAFAGSDQERVPQSYIEFAERKVLPQFAYLREEQIQEEHRRDGFEVGNADKIFESTSSGQTKW